MEKRLVAITNVVADDVRLEALLNFRRIFKPGKGGESADVIREADFTAVGGSESNTGFRRHFVNDLTHAAAFIAAGDILQNDDGLGIDRIIARARQVEIGHVGRGAADAVGDETDAHAGAFEVRLGARVVKLVDLIDAMLVDALIKSGAEQRDSGTGLNAATRMDFIGSVPA